MNILIIGNGFDVAHQLPTQYRDFLNLCSIATRIEVMWINNQPSVSLKNINGVECLEYIDFAKDVAASLGIDLWEEFEDIIQKNFWIKYFQVRKEVIGEKWIDFEDEIRIAIDTLYNDMSNSHDITIRSGTITNSEIARFCKDNKTKCNLKTYRDLFSLLNDNLKEMIRAIEIYMDGYINLKEIEKLSIFSNEQVERIVSFNYTDTYAENYKAEVECCYIHGKADIRRMKDECNLVLGFDDHYLNDKKVKPELIPFEKYYQRIVKKTDNQYFEWLEEMKCFDENKVIIFGHSLGETDGDILSKFILTKNVKTRIICYDEYDRAEKIRNLAVILVPDKLIELTGGSNPSITFEIYKN